MCICAAIDVERAAPLLSIPPFRPPIVTQDQLVSPPKELSTEFVLNGVTPFNDENVNQWIDALTDIYQ